MKSKSNNTSENVLKMLKFILKKEEFSIADIISYMVDFDILIERETVHKYIRTLKKAGFDFQKIDAKTYKILRLPILLKNTEINSVENILSAMNNDCSLKNVKIIEKLLRLLPENKYPQNTFSFNKKQMAELQKLEKYIKDNLRLEVQFKKHGKNREKIIFELYSFFLENDGVFLKGYDVTDRKRKVFGYETISKIIQTPVKNRFLFGDKEAVIKFSHKMAKTYILKDGEQILGKSKDSLLVKTNYYEEKSFFEKILRYVDHCEIIKPQYLRENFVGYVKKLLEIYAVS